LLTAIASLIDATVIGWVGRPRAPAHGYKPPCGRQGQRIIRGVETTPVEKA
jgi:hypothetical protein